MWNRVWKWLFLGVFLPCLPFGFSVLAVFNHGSDLTGKYSLPHFWERGELLLIAITLVAAGIYDLLNSNMGELKNLKILVTCFALTLLLAAAAWYSQISSCILLNQTYDLEFTRARSPLLFIFSAVSGLVCVVLSKET